jgi:predicted ATPase
MLFLIDNCEHVLDGAAKTIASLLQSCPELHILATSRVSLRLPGETVYPVKTLPRPEAVQHFVRHRVGLVK